MKQNFILILGLLFSLNLIGQTIDTIPFPVTHNEDVRIINFYKAYKAKTAVSIHLVINSSADNNGKNWYTTYSEGILDWINETTLKGNLDILYDSRKKAIGSLLTEIFNQDIQKVELEIDVTNGRVNLKDEEFFIYPTEIRNSTIYGFNNSNKTLIITFENP